MPYTQAVTDYYSGIPRYAEQHMHETIFWGALDGLSKEEIKPKLLIKGIPLMPDAVLNEMYAVLAKEISKMPRFEDNGSPKK